MTDGVVRECSYHKQVDNGLCDRGGDVPDMAQPHPAQIKYAHAAHDGSGSLQHPQLHHHNARLKQLGHLVLGCIPVS